MEVKIIIQITYILMSELSENMYLPLLLIRAPLAQQSGSQHLNQLGPMFEGHILSSSPHSSHGRLVLGISLKTSSIKKWNGQLPIL